MGHWGMGGIYTHSPANFGGFRPYAGYVLSVDTHQRPTILRPICHNTYMIKLLPNLLVAFATPVRGTC